MFSALRPTADIVSEAVRIRGEAAFHIDHYANHDASLFLDESRSGFLVLRVRIVSTPHTTGKPNCGPGSERITSLRKQAMSSKQERRPGRLAARRCFACYPSGKGDP